MQASTLKDAAETVTGTVGGLARTVAEISPDVTAKVGDVSSKVGDTALRLAALTPWVEQATRSRPIRRWILMIGAAMAVVGVLGWLKTNRRAAGGDAAPTSSAPDSANRHLKAAAGR